MNLKQRMRENISRLTPRASHLAAVTLCLLLASCGFHLRGSAPLPFETLYISGSPSFATQLARGIRSGSSTRVVSNAKEAQVTLQVVGEQNERVILSLSGSGRVREIQLRYRISYRLSDSEGRELMPVTEVQLKRDLSYSDTDVLGKEQEEQLLVRDMRNDAVQQVLRRLQVARLDAAPKSAP